MKINLGKIVNKNQLINIKYDKYQNNENPIFSILINELLHVLYYLKKPKEISQYYINIKILKQYT